MSNEKKITLSFDLEQVANDILAKCNLISTTVKDEAMEDIRANIQEPDNPETRSIINRAVTEAFGNLKVASQRYLRTGRTTDNNMLEQMVRNVTYASDGEGNATDEIDTIEYETVVLELYIPNFNTSVTDALKSQMHKYVVDYVMGRFLQDQHADKATEYKDLADGEDYGRIIRLLNSRESFINRKPSWV
mgnify:CR=1 FL=1